MNNNSLDKSVARRIIETVGGQGTPPEYGFQFFTAGLDLYLDTIEEEYLKTLIKDGGSSFKMVIGIYGGGKTHFLYNIREIAWNYNYITSYITLSPEQTPFYRLEQVYKAVVNNLIYPQSPKELLQGYDRGIEAVIKKWYFEKYQELRKTAKNLSEESLLEELNAYAVTLGPYESPSFKNAVKESFLAVGDERNEDFSLILQWLKGENPPKRELNRFRIFEKIDKSTAFKMIRSLVQWIRGIGYTGMIVLMDEAEQAPSMTSKQKILLLNNLRELIDECGRLELKNTMWFYAVPDENFLEGQSQIYEALRQRVATVFNSETNPSGVKIYLENIPIEPLDLLQEIGQKLANIYEIAYDIKFDPEILAISIKNIAEFAYSRKFEIGYKRLFVQSVIKAFHKMRKTNSVVTAEDIEM